MVPHHRLTRRAAVLPVASAAAAMLPVRRVRAQQLARPVAHAHARPGITGAKVLTAAQMTRSSDLVELFDGIREIPHIADGIGCHCRCAEFGGHRSLLTCYEGDAMALSCPICQGEGRVAVRLTKAGKSLDEIRAAIDAQFG